MNGNVLDPVIKEEDGRKRYFCPVVGCPHAKATKEGYFNRRGYNKHFSTFHFTGEKIGFLSMLNWGSPGLSLGSIRKAFRICEAEGVDFIGIIAGICSYPEYAYRFTRPELLKTAEDLGLYEETKKGRKIYYFEEARDWLINEIAEEIADGMPHIRHGRKDVKIYLVTSPASTIDGWLGREVARRLVRLRKDILFWGEGFAYFQLQKHDATVGALTFIKPPWRSKYYSTAVDRLIEDHERQTSKDLPDLWVVGGTASSTHRPPGEKKVPYVSLPALHELQKINSAENQVGLRIVEFLPQSNDFLVRTYNLKDDIANKRTFVPEPKNTTELQLGVVATLKNEVEPQTIGQLEAKLKTPRGQISKAIKELNNSKYEPKIDKDQDSKRYDFNTAWMQNKLEFPDTNFKALQEETFLGFGCLHAGSIYSEYEWFVQECPRIILEHNIKNLVAAGDLIEGLEHDLDKRGEVMGGSDYSDQQIFAARLIGSVVSSVFQSLFSKAMERYAKRKPSNGELKTIVENALMNSYFIPGNHCSWTRRKGIKPLTEFEPKLVEYLTTGIENELEKRGLQIPRLNKLVEAQVMRGEDQILKSGLGLTIRHPGMSRTLTSSLRAQHTLDQTNTPTTMLANFHVAIAVEQWEKELGQRVAMQLGSIVWKTEYEHDKLKGRLDVGVGYLKTLADENQRILVTEMAYFGGGNRKAFTNRETFLDPFMADLGI
ncbi:MAG: hypothetical protein UY40_C0002G0040 [candidate division CPR1 bacterium GW2011_GWC1_49_13]|uniref:Uncharacterized protein n=1 Tax=candidate division CPR1 bacterium GW2011_GWC1_49_13 TaxID=1618342 RepID=A0A0G1VJ05_9BACT|nr:MAG: hypothetical protein UY40_C0002G0040 [candidate division CPR1 bacterium GW2011_GWC1_49_13]